MRRVDAIDVARGLAMVMVFINHGIVWFNPTTPEWIVMSVYRLSDFCIPMFMAISGMTMVYLLRGSTRSPSYTRQRYLKRGIQLLVVGHILITLGTWPLYRHDRTLIELLLLRWHITDSIAICLFLVPHMIMRLSRRQRLILALTLPVVCRMVTAFWDPANPVIGGLQEFLCGIDDYNHSPVLDNTYPLGPYLAMFLLGTVLAPMYLTAVKNVTLLAFLRRFAIVLLGLFVLGTILTSMYLLLIRKLFDPTIHGDWLGFFYPSKISALMPIYLAMGGAIFMAIVLWVDYFRRFGLLTFSLVVFGRTSFFAYVVQYFLIQGIPAAMGLTHSVGLWHYLLLMVIFTFFLFLICYGYARWKGIMSSEEYQILHERIRGGSCRNVEHITKGIA